MNEELMDQSQLAQSVSEKIKYEFKDKFLIKPLDAVKVTKEFSKPVSKEQPKKDENGIEAVDYDEVETEVKEVDSDFRKGVVLKIPFSYVRQMADEKWPEMPIKVGDVVFFRDNVKVWFDLLKDTVLVDSYGILGVEKTNDTNKQDLQQNS